MGILKRMAAERRDSLESASVSLANPPDWVFEAFGGGKSKAGVRVNETALLGHSAVVGAVRVRADAIAQIPPVLYLRKPKGRERATDHPAYGLVHDRPNPAMARSVFLATADTHVSLWGNFYAEIERDGGGRPVALWPLMPDRSQVVLRREQGLRVLVTRGADGKEYGIPEPYFLHIPGWSLDGLCGLALRQMGKESLGTVLATQEHASRFFSNGARPGMIIEHPSNLKNDAATRLRESVDRWVQSVDKHYRTLVLEENSKAHDYGFDAEASQLLESRRFGIEDVSRVTRVPLHRISSLENAHYNNLEQQSQDFLSDCVNPSLVVWEQVLTWELLTAKERAQGYYFEFLREALLQMDAAARSTLYRELFMIGAITRAEIRHRENFDQLPDDQLPNETFIPLNLVPARMAVMVANTAGNGSGEEDGGGETPPEGGGDDAPPATEEEAPKRALATGRAEVRAGAKRSARLRQRYHAAYVPVIATAANRVVRRETNELRRLVDKVMSQGGSAAEVLAAAAEMYRALPETVRREMAPVIASLAAVVRDTIHDEVGGSGPATDVDRLVTEYVGAMAERHVRVSRGQLQQLADDGADADTFRGLLDEWDQGRPNKIGTQESVRAGGFMAVALYRGAGVRTLTWVGGDCPLCSSMNGRTTEIAAPFLRDGDTVHPGDGSDTAPMPVNSDIGHPPLHGACDCVVAAG